jgi:hypothetical protein
MLEDINDIDSINEDMSQWSLLENMDFDEFIEHVEKVKDAFSQ